MKRYMNLSGTSGVAYYELGDDYIKVQFTDGVIYLYNYGSAGTSAIEQMKGLALQGFGLNSFINRNVRKNYARKY